MNFDLNILKRAERTALQLRALAERSGYRKYHMGRFEEYGLYQQNRSFLASEQVLTFTDLDGRLLALKPDVTLSIAKNVQPAPGQCEKYYYNEKVYRPSRESHTFVEISGILRNKFPLWILFMKFTKSILITFRECCNLFFESCIFFTCKFRIISANFTKPLTVNITFSNNTSNDTRYFIPVIFFSKNCNNCS